MGFPGASGPPTPGPMGREQLDTPPPPPSDNAGAAAGLLGQPVSPQGVSPAGGGSVLAGLVNAPSTPAQAVTGLVSQASDIDQALIALSSAAPGMGPKLGQARALIKAAVAEFLSTAMSGPVPAGPSFPGGGIGSA